MGGRLTRQHRWILMALVGAVLLYLWLGYRATSRMRFGPLFDRVFQPLNDAEKMRHSPPLPPPAAGSPSPQAN
jgi:hypothetical protein